MDRFQKENWAKIKAHLQKIGKTDNDYYRRACDISAGRPDPIDDIFKENGLGPKGLG